MGGWLTSGRVPCGGALLKGFWEEGSWPTKGPQTPKSLAPPSLHQLLPLLDSWLVSFSAIVCLLYPPRFMEFEEEEMETQKLQWLQGAQGLPFQGPPRPDPPEPLAPVVDLQPGKEPRSHYQR